MSPHPEPKPEVQVTEPQAKLGKMKMYEPSPAYSPMDINFDRLNVDMLDSDSPGSTSRCDSPLLLPSPETSLIDKIHAKIESKDKFFSLEFFPPRTKSGAINLLSRLERMSHGHPLFIDITWHPSGNPASDSETSSTMIAQSAINYVGVDTMLHMTCLGCPKQNISNYLQKCKTLGIRNILALRGDAPADESNEVEKAEKHLFAAGLVKQIRDEWGSEFTICVAGYPQGHPDAESYELDLLRLKEKVDAGADFIITQLFYKASTFKRFVDDCRAVGIECPILPGIMPIQSYDSLRHITKLSRLDVPSEITKIIAPLKGNDDAIRNFGVHMAVDMIKDLFHSGYAPGVHIYTLNREVAATAILKRLGMWNVDMSRYLPFKQISNPRRVSEDVRPIFWNKRSRTYVYRTRHWDEFPNGRWGNSASPAFGELKDYYLFYLASRTPLEEQKAMWGIPLESEEDVWGIFEKYLTGEPNINGVTVNKLIFNEECLDPETELIAGRLAAVNKRGILTVNSQPSVNCAPSTDPKVGWGKPGGYVFQKAYLEFFTNEENVVALLQVIGRYPSVNFHVINHDATFNCTNNVKLEPNAVTWGVFPSAEVKQPTIVDPVSFRAWSEEAFALWSKVWGKLYDQDSKSRKVIDKIATNYYLVNLVDNDFAMGNCIWNLIEDALDRRKLNSILSKKITLENTVEHLQDIKLLTDERGCDH